MVLSLKPPVSLGGRGDRPDSIGTNSLSNTSGSYNGYSTVAIVIINNEISK